MGLSGNVLTLNGKAKDENAVANYIANLDASPFFGEPELKDMRSAGEESFSFQLSCVFNYTPQVAEAAAGGGAGA